MKYYWSIIFSLLISNLCFSQNLNKSTGFIENKGQIVDQNGKSNQTVKYLLNTNGLNIQLRQNGFSYDVYETKKQVTKKSNQRIIKAIPDHKEEEEITFKNIYHRIDIDFVNCNLNSTLKAEEKSTDYDNYYNVVSKPEGVLNVHRFQKVTYQNIYPNIDIVFFIPKDTTKPVEYNFVIKPNGKIADIQMKFSGTKTEIVDNKIKMKIRFGEMEETLPMSWIENKNEKKEVVVNYKKISKNIYGFETDENISNQKVIIDPVPIRLWGTYYGGSGGEMSGSILIDSNNNVLISGGTGSLNNIATTGSNTSGYTSGNAFIAKFNTNGDRIWSSYYPFSTSDMKIDQNDNMYVFGSLLQANPNIPSTGCHQSIKDIYTSGFLIKLNSSGAKEWGTYYGGNQNETIYDLSVDNNGNIYIVGGTNSTNAFSTPGAFQTTKSSTGDYETGFIAKFDSLGNRIWGTFYGGELADGFYNCDISDDGYLYASGTHNSQNNITTPGAYQTAFNGTGGMIVKFDLNGNRIWGTFIADKTYTLRCKLKGDNIYLTGRAFPDSNIGTPGTFQETFQTLPSGSTMSGNENSFICKFNYQMQQYIWGSYFLEQIIGIDIDSNNNVFFSGSTNINSGIATPDSYLPNKTNYHQSYLIKLNQNGQRTWGTYYGGNYGEQLGNVSIDYNNDIYLYGITSSVNGIATLSASQTTLGSNPDTYLVKFRDCQSLATVNSNSPICLGEDLNLTASGGTGYSWTGPNGFTSNLQNPIIPNTTSLNSGQYACSISGSGGCDDTITIDVLIGDTTKPIPDITTLPTITGDCNITISAPTATDNCSGNIVGTTTTQVNILPSGSHTIVWNYNDGNGNIETQNQAIIINQVTLPSGNPSQSFCIQQSATINDIIITGQNIKWYDSETGGNLLSSSTILVDGMTYYASQTLNSCESSRIPITIQIHDTSAPTGSNQSFCTVQNPTLNNIIINGSTIKWYSDNISTTELPQTTSLTDNTTYYATQTLNGCESITRLPITISLISTLNANDYLSIVCDNGNDGTETTNLTAFNSFLITSLQGNTFTYYKSLNGAENQISSEQLNNNHSIQSGVNTIFVRIDSSNGCHQIVQLQLTLVNVPEIPILDEITLCETGIVSVNAGSGFNSYTWSNNATTQSIVINQAGSYWVTVTKNHNSTVCSSTKNFTVVLSNKPTITSINTIDWTDFENSITVNVTGLGDYEYSIDGINFQESPVFSGLSNGVYTITVKDTKECGIATKQVYLLNYPKFFTPNGDGHNDTWKVKFSQFEENFVTQIFDRYGKLIKVLNNLESWDGTYNGKQLPSDDYWFQITRKDGRIHRGHFAMLR